jgi:hypothetical protein
MQTAPPRPDLPHWRPTAFDCVVLAGAGMNLLVIAVLAGYWWLGR